ncbi:MAG: pyridoxamine 5'-phosphate oxidase family protein [bacterium]
MSSGHVEALRGLLAAQPIAALGTLHGGAPYVSMTPFATVPGRGFAIHVSGLAAHTKDMLENPAVSLLVIQWPNPAVSPQAAARCTIRGTARRCGESDPDHAAARRAYLARFPDTEPMFGFGDFSLFLIAPEAGRLVGGFAQARSLRGEEVLEALAATA